MHNIDIMVICILISKLPGRSVSYVLMGNVIAAWIMLSGKVVSSVGSPDPCMRLGVGNFVSCNSSPLLYP